MSTVVLASHYIIFTAKQAFSCKNCALHYIILTVTLRALGCTSFFVYTTLHFKILEENYFCNALHDGNNSPLPNISTLAILISPEHPPKTPKWGPQNEFPRIPRTEGFCGNSAETPNFSEFPGPSRFRILRSPFSAFWGGGKWSWYFGQRWVIM